MIVADAWWHSAVHGARGLAAEEVAARGRFFHEVAEEVGATALGAFVWDSFPGVPGTRDLAPNVVRDY